jgi:hypothetical protein
MRRSQLKRRAANAWVRATQRDRNGKLYIYIY